MKKILALLAVLGTAVIAGQHADKAQAATCALGDRSCWRVMLLRNCVPLNSSYTQWACPDQPPRATKRAMGTNAYLESAVRLNNGNLCVSGGGCRMYYKNNSTGAVSYIGAGAGFASTNTYLVWPSNTYVFMSIYGNAYVYKSADYQFNIWGWQNCPTGGGAHLSDIHTMGPGFGAFKASAWWAGNLVLRPGCFTG